MLTLGRNESLWGTKVEDLPPSVGEYVGFNGTNSRRSLSPSVQVGRSYRNEFGGLAKLGQL